MARAGDAPARGVDCAHAVFITCVPLSFRGANNEGQALRHPLVTGACTSTIVIPSDAVRSRAKRRGSRNPFFSVAKRHR